MTSVLPPKFSMARFAFLSAAVLMAAIYSAICAADDPVPVKSHWGAYAKTTDEPGHISSTGPARLISDGGSPGDRTKSVISVWLRAEYLKPQKTGDKTYTFEYKQILVDCGHHRYKLLRDAKSGADGSLISDVKIDGKWKPVNFEFEGDAGQLPLDEEFAIAATDFGCH